MNTTDFETWLERYGQAWVDRDPEAAAALFSEDAEYYETPFGEPARGRDGVRGYWADATGNQSDVTFSYQVVSCSSDAKVARWKAEFTRASSGVTVRLDGVFLLRFDAAGLCRELREWWHIVEARPPEPDRGDNEGRTP